MDGPAADNPPGTYGDNAAILRVSRPWPAGTRNALRISLDHGSFEDIRVLVPSGPGLTEEPVYFTGAVNEQVGSSISRCKA
jgi:hypothetical protein